MGLRVDCILDKRRYPDKIKITDKQMATIRLVPDPFHGHWNYTIRPRPRKKKCVVSVICSQFLSTGDRSVHTYWWHV